MRIPAEEQANLFIVQMSFEKIREADSKLSKLINAIHFVKMNLDFMLDDCAEGITSELLDYLRDVKREVVNIEMKVMKERADEPDRRNINSPHDDMAK